MQSLLNLWILEITTWVFRIAGTKFKSFFMEHTGPGVKVIPPDLWEDTQLYLGLENLLLFPLTATTHGKKDFPLGAQWAVDMQRGRAPKLGWHRHRAQEWWSLPKGGSLFWSAGAVPKELPISLAWEAGSTLPVQKASGYSQREC